MKKFRNILTAGILALTCTISAIGTTIPTSYAEETENADPTIYMDPNGVEFVDYDNTCYFSDANGNVFEFNKIYSISDGVEPPAYISSKAFPKGIVCRPYKGEEEPFYVQDCSKDLSVGDTEGTFVFEGQEYNYDLLPPSMMMFSFSKYILQLSIHIHPVNEVVLSELDFNKDGKINVSDAVLYNRTFSATPFIHVTNLSTDEFLFDTMTQENFFKILDDKYQKGEEEIVIRYGDDIDEDETIQTETNFAEIIEPAEITMAVETTDVYGIAEVPDEVKPESQVDDIAVKMQSFTLSLIQRFAMCAKRILEFM